MDPLGLIGGFNGVDRVAPQPGRAAGASSSPDFKQFLRDQISEVNRLQSDATAAVEDLAAGRRDDMESVIIATHKADIAFDMLVSVRNKVMEAYEEIKQIRV